MELTEMDPIMEEVEYFLTNISKKSLQISLLWVFLT